MLDVELAGHHDGVKHSIVYLINVKFRHSLIRRGREVVLLYRFLHEVEIADAITAVHLCQLQITDLLAIFLGIPRLYVILAKHLNLLLVLRFIPFL